MNMCGIHQYFIVFFAFCAAVSLGFPISSRQKIAQDMSNTAAPTGSDCEHRTPCAWGVYVPFTRKVDYYMKNTCVCPKDTKCTRMEDDISVSAYIYRCARPDPNRQVDDPYSEFPLILPDYVTRSSS